MSIYEVNRFLHQLAADVALRGRVQTDPDTALNGFGLTALETALIRQGEVGELYLHGADGFLLHNMQRFGVFVPDMATYSERMRAAAGRPRKPPVAGPEKAG